MKFLNGLQKDVALRVLDKLDNLREEPFRYLKHYEGADVYKFRIGGYRMLIDVDLKLGVLVVEVFDKRGRVYK